MKARLKAIGAAVGRKSKKLAAVAFVSAMPVVAFAQDTVTEGDVSASSAKVALWLTGAITLSAAFTAAIISIRASKLPRRGS